MATRTKNATQHPGHILTGGDQAKKRTKKDIAADKQREKRQRRQMWTDQAAARADAPKLSCPHPRPRAIKKAVKTTDTSTTTDAQAGAGLTTGKASGAKGKGDGHGGKSAAGANIEHPASDEELEVPASRRGKTNAKGKKKALKTPVRDIIEGAGIIESTMPRDVENHQKSDGDVSLAPEKYQLAGRISGWGSKPIPKKKPSTAALPSEYSRPITKGSTNISSSANASAPPLTPISTPDAGGDSAIRFSTLFEDNSDDEVNERSAALSRHVKNTEDPMVNIDEDNETDLDKGDGADLIEDDGAYSTKDDGADFIEDDGTDFVKARPSMQPFPLVNYDSDSDLESSPSAQVLPVADYDSDINFPPFAQPPSSRTPPYYCAESLKRKLTDELLFLSSDVEIVERPDDLTAVVKKELQPAPVQLTSATGVAVTHKAPAAKRLKSSTAKTASHANTKPSQATESTMVVLAHSNYRMKHLPEGCQVSGKWSGKVIPTLIHCIGSQDEVWTLKDDLLCTTLQSIWDVVYKGSITHTVTPDGPVIAVALQQLSEWQNSLSSTALVVLANFLSSQKDLKTDEDRKNISIKLLHKLAFLFGDIRDNGIKHTRPYESDLIVQVLVQHHCATVGAVHVQGTTTSTYGKGTLGLATTVACLVEVVSSTKSRRMHAKTQY
ncbi:uncharacterized protein HD556DRAFT_1308746 [Suillus plorans]|uniref:Uncharacterized protein n=1 Tax=Suillus plorans TaxID=116603 RepID=A0A9P7DHQ2_9AGAM|nr:uncharacterized protein HD556DRAFT_1308746 [Suillus plorans]KAG1793317.1 hypothetical protein HD556DRAFT_1308746 [Suillus plorans]